MVRVSSIAAGAPGATPPYTDLLTLTDAAEALPEIDATRTAAMGGSFGGYLANWLAGHTDRFAAIVTHASLWTLDQASYTSDEAVYLLREMTAEMRAAHSPHSHGHAITTPMLVIHGDGDGFPRSPRPGQGVPGPGSAALSSQQKAKPSQSLSRIWSSCGPRQ